MHPVALQPPGLILSGSANALQTLTHLCKDRALNCNHRIQLLVITLECKANSLGVITKSPATGFESKGEMQLKSKTEITHICTHEYFSACLKIKSGLGKKEYAKHSYR